MRIALYGLPFAGTTALTILAALLDLIGGVKAVWRRASVFTADQVEEFAVVLVRESDPAAAEIARAYSAKDVPVFLLPDRTAKQKSDEDYQAALLKHASVAGLAEVLEAQGLAVAPLRPAKEPAPQG